jgi:hypothetical protein
MMTAGLCDRAMGGGQSRRLLKGFFLPKQVPTAEILRESTFRVNLESDRLRNF